MIATFTVQNISGGIILGGTTVDANSIPFDHAALVTALQSRADGFDLRLIDHLGEVVPLVSIQNANTAACRIVFNVTTDFENGVTLAYTLQHGDLSRQVTPYGTASSGAATVACVVTFASATLPTPSFPFGSIVGRGADQSPYPDALSTRSNYRNNTPRTRYDISYANITPADWYEVRAFVHGQRGGASAFTHSVATFLPSGSYAIVPDSARFVQSSRTGYAAGLAVEGVLP